MALELIGETVVETLIGELIKAILDEGKKAAEFQAIFDRLQSTLISIGPTIQEIERLNKESDRSKETEQLVQMLKDGKELIQKCSKVTWWHYHKKWKYSNKLLDLDESLLRFFQVDMAVQGFRDIKEIKLGQRDPYHLKLGPCQAPDPPPLTLPEDVGRPPWLKCFVMIIKLKSLFQHNGHGVRVFQNDEDAVNQLERLLNQIAPAPILLVLDDVWGGSESLLDNFVFKIPNYKILVTSRFEFPRFGSTYKLPLLKDEDAMTLFRSSAFQQDGRSYMPDEDLVERVVGRSLCGQPAEAWESRLLTWSEGQSIFSSDSDLLLCLQSSLDALADKGILKECFMDLGSFPEDQKIPATALIDMWAELYKLHTGGVFAINNLQELSFRNLLSLVDARKDESDVDGCYNDTYVMLHDLLRELAIYQSSQEPIEQRKRLIVDLSGDKVPNWWTQDNQQPFGARLLSISTDELFSSSWCNIQTPELEVLILNFQSKENYTLPEFMKQMEKLKVLVLTNNGPSPVQLINFSVLGSLPSLKRIRFEQVRIPPLCNTTAEFKNLEKISLVMCKISEALSNRSIQISNMFPNLVELNIDYCNDLVELLEGLCDLVELKKLSISNCPKLSALPKGIGKLGNLEVLRLRDCVKLSGLPDSIGRLHKLSVLDISGCLQIKEIPKQMGELCNLRKIHMRECWSLCRSELPASVMNLVGLKKVICDTETAKLWEPFEYHLKNLRISVPEENINLNWL
ncbi:putative disease resistance protein [Vitis vinifera]|uniref:Putative disease resistance protein n=1 Tax=Vitis vinifera TaxID=29760 RepID=A0A438FC86_VITVI|nr:putative disease resistance protein [Vitis vinifera]